MTDRRVTEAAEALRERLLGSDPIDTNEMALTALRAADKVERDSQAATRQAQTQRVIRVLSLTSAALIVILVLVLILADL